MIIVRIMGNIKTLWQFLVLNLAVRSLLMGFKQSHSFTNKSSARLVIKQFSSTWAFQMLMMRPTDFVETSGSCYPLTRLPIAVHFSLDVSSPDFCRKESHSKMASPSHAILNFSITVAILFKTNGGFSSERLTL